MLEIDWSRIKSIDDVLNIDKDLLFDDSQSFSPTEFIKSGFLKGGASYTEEEQDEAFFLKDYNNGLMLITGEPGSGKGILSHMLAYKRRYYFGKIPIIDTRPRQAFGSYIPFGESMLAEQVERMSEMESGIPRPYVVKGLNEISFDKDVSGWEYYKQSSVQEQFEELKRRDIVPQNAALTEYNKRRDEFVATVEFKPYIDKGGRWITSRGDVFLVNSTVLMDEFGNKYMGRLDPPNLGIKKVLLKEFNFHRHMNCLMLGVGVSLDDFDRKCFPKATWEACCERLSDFSDNPEDIIIGVKIWSIVYNKEMDRIFHVPGTKVVITINASEPKHMLGVVCPQCNHHYAVNMPPKIEGVCDNCVSPAVDEETNIPLLDTENNPIMQPTKLNGLCWKDVYNTANSQGFSLPAKMRRA